MDALRSFAEMEFKFESPFWLGLSVASVTASSLLYTWIWLCPDRLVKKVAPADPCARMAVYAHLLKVVQFIAMTMSTDWSEVVTKSTRWELLLPAVALVGFGQLLNTRVYQLLGQTGVYYGVRFGKPVPWVSAWPYPDGKSWGRVRDPQYVGSMCTLAGLWLAGGPTKALGYWFLNYLYLMWLESEEDESTRVKPEARADGSKAEGKAE